VYVALLKQDLKDLVRLKLGIYAKERIISLLEIIHLALLSLLVSNTNLEMVSRLLELIVTALLCN